MSVQFFISVDGSIKGPFTEMEVHSLESSFPQMLIWGQGMAEWLSHSKWSIALQNPVQPTKGLKGVASITALQRKWKLRSEGEETEDLTYEQLIDILKSKTDLDAVRVWTDGYSDWREIFQIHQIADELGVSRRKHPRVPIMGTLHCEGIRGAFDLKVLSVSEGGLGASEGLGCKIGERLKVILRSPNLYSPIHATVEVVYVAPTGYVGLKFVGIQVESKSTIIEYVRKFQDEKTRTQAAAS